MREWIETILGIIFGAVLVLAIQSVNNPCVSVEFRPDAAHTEKQRCRAM